MRPRTSTDVSVPLRLNDQLSRPKLPGPKMQSWEARSADVETSDPHGEERGSAARLEP